MKIFPKPGVKTRSLARWAHVRVAARRRVNSRDFVGGRLPHALCIYELFALLACKNEECERVPIEQWNAAPINLFSCRVGNCVRALKQEYWFFFFLIWTKNASFAVFYKPCKMKDWKKRAKIQTEHRVNIWTTQCTALTKITYTRARARIFLSQPLSSLLEKKDLTSLHLNPFTRTSIYSPMLAARTSRVPPDGLDRLHDPLRQSPHGIYIHLFTVYIYICTYAEDCACASEPHELRSTTETEERAQGRPYSRARGPRERERARRGGNSTVVVVVLCGCGICVCMWAGVCEQREFFIIFRGGWRCVFSTTHARFSSQALNCMLYR